MQSICSKKLSQILKKNLSILTDKSEQEFATRMFSGSLERYSNRIKQYNLVSCENVLDAGAGLGQWSIALSLYNKHVTAIEYSKERTQFIKSLVDELEIENISVKQGSITDMEFHDSCFDGLFCYGVLVQTPWKKAIKEFKRVSKSKSIIYLNANDIGWFRFLWETQHNKSTNYNPRERVALAFQNTYLYENKLEVNFPTPTIISHDALLEYLKYLGFSNIKIGEEGCLFHESHTGTKGPKMFKGIYRGDYCVFEVLMEN